MSAVLIINASSLVNVQRRGTAVTMEATAA
jgi:hypothetical protein